MAEKRLQGSESSIWDFRGKKIPGEDFQEEDQIIDPFGAIILDKYGQKLVELKTVDIILEAYFAYKRLLLTSSDYNTPDNRARLIIIHKAIDDIQHAQILQSL